MYTHPFHAPLHFLACSAIGSMSWLHTVAVCHVVRVVDEWKPEMEINTLLTRQGGHVTSPSKLNKMQNLVGDPSGCTT